MITPVTNTQQLHDRLWFFLDQVDLPGNNRARLTGAAFRFVVDCHEAIALLTHKGLHGLLLPSCVQCLKDSKGGIGSAIARRTAR